jgi:hypothetical protein
MTKLSFVALMLIAALPAFANDQPFVVSSPFNSATPFNVTLPATTADGKAVKTVVIEFVTADCQAVTGVAAIGAAEVKALFRSNFAIYALPFGPAMSFVNATEFVASEKTLIFADPGSQLNFGLSANQPTCTVVLSGYLR